MTGGRCFLPSFEDDCKDGGRNSLKGKVYFSVDFFFFFYERGEHDRERQIQAASWQPLWKWQRSFQPPAAATNPKCRANTSFSRGCFRFPPQRAVLQHVCMIKLDFACSKRSLQFIFTQTAAVISQKPFFFFFACSHWKNNSLTVRCICPSSCSGCEGSHCSSLA